MSLIGFNGLISRPSFGCAFLGIFRGSKMQKTSSCILCGLQYSIEFRDTGVKADQHREQCSLQHWPTKYKVNYLICILTSRYGSSQCLCSWLCIFSNRYRTYCRDGYDMFSVLLETLVDLQ